jgi:CDP-diacylglycerol--serine O-phosphatidyltransferase
MTTKRRFSMIRDFHLADWFTLGNAFCGTGAIFAALRFLQDGRQADLLLGMGLIPIAFVFDALDGRIARSRHTSSVLGRELDSLSDVISFGVAPAALAYACGMQGGWDWLILSYFVCCGVSRLARYNVTAESLTGTRARSVTSRAPPSPPASRSWWCWPSPRGRSASVLRCGSAWWTWAGSCTHWCCSSRCPGR